MRMRRFRLKIWTLLVLVALVAVCIGGEQMRRRRALYLEEVSYYTMLEGSVLDSVKNMDAWWKQRAAEYTRRRRKYEHAAAHPWESVPPDPPLSWPMTPMDPA